MIKMMYDDNIELINIEVNIVFLYKFIHYISLIHLNSHSTYLSICFTYISGIFVLTFLKSL